MTRGIRGVWWLSPVGVTLLVAVPTLLLAHGLSNSSYLAHYRTTKALTTSTFVLFIIGLTAFAAGAAWPQLGRRRDVWWAQWPRLDDRTIERLRRTTPVLFWLTVLGYVLWAVAGARAGVGLSTLASAFTSLNTYDSELSAHLPTVAGVTTLTQFDIAFVVIASLIPRRQRTRTLNVQFVVILGLALVRTYLNSERLAMIELLLPMLAIAMLRMTRNPRARLRAGLKLAPLLLVPVLIAGFGLFEYSRSYVFFAKTQHESLVEFSAIRLGGYYATAYGNGELLLQHGQYEGRLPYASVQALWTAPVIDQLDAYHRLTGHDDDHDYAATISRFGSSEFNSPSGPGVIYLDFGRVGGTVLLFVLGSVMGYAYRRFCEGTLGGVLLYPALVTGLFELPRQVYWSLGRFAPALLALAVVWVLAKGDVSLRRRRPAWA